MTLGPLLAVATGVYLGGVAAEILLALVDFLWDLLLLQKALDNLFTVV